LSTTEPATPFAKAPAIAARLAAREVLAAAWPLFQVSLPACLPLALLGVVASGVPGAVAVASGETRGFLHSGLWWALYALSTALMLVCYGAILRLQLARSVGTRLAPLVALAQGAAGLLPALAVVLLVLVGLAAGLALLVVPGLAVLVWCFFAWPAQVEERLGPLAALRRSVALSRGRFMAVAGVVGALVAAVLVFVLLTGILLAVVLNLAGIGTPTGHAGLSISRWLMAALLSLPVVYVGAVSVAGWRAAKASS
jgi:hypothetical protein